MKKVTKLLLGIGAVACLSAAVGGVTASYFLKKNATKDEVKFSDIFQQDNARLAAFNSVNAQPVDLTEAAEISINAVVHIKSTLLNVSIRLQSVKVLVLALLFQRMDIS